MPSGKDFKVESRKGALYAGEKADKTHLQLVRYSPEPIILAQLLCLLYISNSTKILQSDDWFLWLVKSFIHQISRKVLGKVCAWVHVSPASPKSHIYWSSPLPNWNSFSELSEIPSPQLQSSFCPVQFSSVTQLCLTLWNLMDCSTPGFPVHHQLPELTQTHVHRVSDPIQPSHSLSSPSPPAFNLSQHQGLFQWVSSLHQVAKVLPPNKI